MSCQSPAFRTAVFQMPDSPAATADSPATWVFWTFQGSGPRAEDGFVFENEIGGSYSMSKRVTDRINWRAAMDVMHGLESEASQKTARVNEKDFDSFTRLQRSDTYRQSGHFDAHPMLVQEREQSRLQNMAASLPKLARRPKPPGPA